MSAISPVGEWNGGRLRSTSPFSDLARRKDTVWLEPVLEAEISYGQIVGRQLRLPVPRRLVTELSPMRTSRPARGGVGRKQSGARLKLGDQPSQGSSVQSVAVTHLVIDVYGYFNEGKDTTPAGAVMFFNLATCPPGWTELVSARGRYLVGLPSAGTLA
jgi:hypothetical protein